MEPLLMHPFERGDSVVTQVQQQADDFRQTIACQLLAAGRQAPDWLLPSRAGGPQPELNGKPIAPGLVFYGSQITTPAANRSIYFPTAIPSTSIRKPDTINAYTQPVNNFAPLGNVVDEQHEEPQQDQISLSKELENACPAPNMFSRIQRSKSRQRNIEGRRSGRDQAANCDGIQAAESNKITMPSSSKSCGDVTNKAETTSSCPGQANGSYASQRRSKGFLKCHSNLGTQEHQLDCLTSPVLEDKMMCSYNNCNASARDLEIVPLPKYSELNIADTMCHSMPETHLLVEPKKLQFDGADPVCMDTSEQTGQQQESALANVHFCLADQNLLSEDPDPSSSSQEPHSMGRSSHGLKSDYLKSVDADLEHKQYGLESGCRDLCANSPNIEPSLSCSTEVPSFVGEPLLPKNTQYVTETISKVCPTQETGLLNSDEANCSERSNFPVNSLLEKDILQTVEDTKKSESSNSKVSPSASSEPLQLPFQQADESFEANASGILMNRLLEENGHSHISNLLTNGTRRRCSLDVSSASIMQLPPQPCISNPSPHETHSNGTHSNGFSAVDAFNSAENMLPQDQYSLSRPSLEVDASVADTEATLDHPPSDIHNKMLTGNTTSELVNYHSGKLGADVHVNKKDIVTPEVISSVSPGRIRKLHETERSTAVPSEKCNEILHQQGIEQEIPPLDNDAHAPINAQACTPENVEHMKSCQSSALNCLHSSVSYEKNNQLQASRGNAQKRSAADGTQVNRGTSSKTKRIKCQGVTNSHSSRTNSLSLSNQDGIGSHLVTAENLSGRSRPSGHYLLRSSGFKEFMSLESEKKNATANSKMSIASDVMEKGVISIEPIKNSHLPNVGIWNSSSRGALSPRLSCSNDSRSAFEGMNFQNSQAWFQTNLDTAPTSTLPSCSNIATDIEECCMQEGNICLEGLGSSTNISSMKHQKMAIQTDENVVLVNQENYAGTDSLSMLPSPDLDEHGKKTSDLVASLHKKLSFDSGVQVETRCEDPAIYLMSDAKTSRLEVDGPIESPEFEGFNVSSPLDSPTTEKRTYESLHDPRRFGTLSSDIPRTYGANTVSGMHQLGATMSEKATSCSFSGGIRQYSVSSDDRIADIFGSLGLGISGIFVPSCSSNGSDKHVSGENPLTPAVEKYSRGKLSARVGSVSEHMGSIPELSCFRIDEDSSIAEENECQDMLPESVVNHVQSGRKVFQDMTGLFSNTEKSALRSLGFMDTSNKKFTTETCSSKLDQNSGVNNDHNNKKPKESDASFVKKEGKVSYHLNRLSKTEVTNKRNQRSTSEANLGKQSKLSNIVTNVASFIPLVKPKPSTTTVKKDVRVKALEAAEAAKRLEEKKQNEREMRKAAAKLEREKMKKEKESKQKQEQEHRKKLDMATKKRQREEEEKREKERKRRRAEESRKHQKQPTERRHPSDEKVSHLKASDNKEMQNNLVQTVRSEVKHDERVDLGNKAITSNNAIVVDGKPANLVSHATENIPNSLDESYEMTPYKDSDDEDYEEDEEEASRRRKKMKPSWVREENLKKILFDDQVLDAREIFRRKRSFYLSDVLPSHVRLRGF